METSSSVDELFVKAAEFRLQKAKAEALASGLYEDDLTPDKASKINRQLTVSRYELSVAGAELELEFTKSYCQALHERGLSIEALMTEPEYAQGPRTWCVFCEQSCVIRSGCFICYQSVVGIGQEGVGQPLPEQLEAARDMVR